MSWNLCKYPECESYTARPDGDYCETHRRAIGKMKVEEIKAAEKRKKLLSKPKTIYKPPNKVSAKRAEENEIYFKLVEQFKKDNPKCKAKCNEYCTKATEDPHHRRGRGQYLLDVRTWLPVCRSCHTYIGAHPAEAIEKGWSMSRLQTTEPHKI